MSMNGRYTWPRVRMGFPKSVTLEDKAKIASIAAQIANGTHGFKERVFKTLGLYKLREANGTQDKSLSPQSEALILPWSDG